MQSVGQSPVSGRVQDCTRPAWVRDMASAPGYLSCSFLNPSISPLFLYDLPQQMSSILLIVLYLVYTLYSQSTPQCCFSSHIPIPSHSEHPVDYNICGVRSHGAPGPYTRPGGSPQTHEQGINVAPQPLVGTRDPKDSLLLSVQLYLPFSLPTKHHFRWIVLMRPPENQGWVRPFHLEQVCFITSFQVHSREQCSLPLPCSLLGNINWREKNPIFLVSHQVGIN